MPKETDSAKRTLWNVLNRYSQRLADQKTIAHSTSTEHLEEHQDVLSYLNTKGTGHRYYRHYATRERVDRILSESAIYLTDGSNWNDKFDRERFNPNFSGWKRFGTCFSAATQESIAMWMLYGGTDGNGAMINP